MDKNFNYVQNFNAIQIELSTNCNALCLGCVRTNDNFTDVKEILKEKTYLNIDLITDLLHSQSGKEIERIEFCGNVDEPFAYPQFYELLEKLYEINPNYIVQIHTNGGLRSIEYHRKVALLIEKFNPKSCLRYSLDGIGETHSFYRQKTKYSKVLENLSAAASTKATVIWQFLVFPWNAHQVDDAKKIAKEIGCKEIWIRPDRSLVSDLGEPFIRVVKEVKGYTRKNNFQIEKFWPRKPDREIACRFRSENYRAVFLSWQGKVWPCCFHSNVIYEKEKAVESFFGEVVGDYDSDFNSLHKHSFDEILNHPFYKRDLMKSWEDPQDKQAWRCNEKCGKKSKTSEKGANEPDLELKMKQLSLTP